jgi:hypothetical protein
LVRRSFRPSAYQRVININVHDKATCGVHGSIRSCWLTEHHQQIAAILSAIPLAHAPTGAEALADRITADLEEKS